MKSSFFSAIFLCPALLSAQVIYTDVNPDSLVTGQYELDLDGNDTAEFIIEAVLDGGINVVQAAGVSSQDLMWGYYGGFPEVVGYPYAKGSGVIIDNTMNLIEGGIMGGNHSIIMDDALWPELINRYLCLKFNINGEAHYGWAKIKISTDYVAFTISEYAYNATAGEGINSGSVGVEENNTPVSELSIFPNPAGENVTMTFSLHDESEVELSVYDLSGKLAYTQSKGTLLPGRRQVQFNVSQLDAGIYFCKVSAGSISSTAKLGIIR